MEKLILCNDDLREEMLISYKGHNFKLKNCEAGQYGFERRVYLFVINKNDLSTSHFKNVGVVRLFRSENLYDESEKRQCLVIGDNTTFDDCIEPAEEYIKKYVDFLK